MRNPHDFHENQSSVKRSSKGADAKEARKTKGMMKPVRGFREILTTVLVTETQQGKCEKGSRISDRDVIYGLTELCPFFIQLKGLQLGQKAYLSSGWERNSSSHPEAGLVV